MGFLIVRGTPPQNPENAHARVFSMMAGLACMGFCGIVLRWPSVESSLIMGSLMCSYVGYDIPDFSRRANVIFLLTLSGGALSFLFGLLQQNIWLTLILMFTACYGLLRLYARASALAIAILVIGVYSMQSTGGWLNSLNRFIFLQYIGLLSLLMTCLVRRIFPLSVNEKILKQVKHEVRRIDAFALAVCVTSGYYLYSALQMPQGYWLSFTILMTHIGGTFGDVSTMRAVSRIFMSPIGLWLGFLFMALLCWFDYLLAYTFPIWVWLGYLIYFKYGLYRWRTMFQMLFFVLMYDCLFGEYQQIDFLNLFVCRSTAVFLGGILAILCEPVRETPFPDDIRLI